MTGRIPDIVQVSTSDRAGGAEAIAFSLFNAYRSMGLSSRLVVGRKVTDDPDVLAFEHDARRHWWARSWLQVRNWLWTYLSEIRGTRCMKSFCTLIGQPGRWLDLQLGKEDFSFPDTRHLFHKVGDLPGIVHAHNLHGGYFDLRVLPWLSRQVPVILTLHDAWLLAGHCAHSFDCQRWKSGCGQCPNLSIPPVAKRDATASNWRRKKAIYANSRVYVATPSHWLMRKVKQSILSPAIVESRVIPNGVDLDVFRPAEKDQARKLLGLSSNSRLILFAANGISANPWKDFATLRGTLALLGRRLTRPPVQMIALGEECPTARPGDPTIQFVPHETDPGTVARYYQAADVYVHAARADTFPNTVLEALACGTPDVATAVGGIVEQVKSWDRATGRGPRRDCHPRVYPLTAATGVLVPPGDAGAMAAALELLLTPEIDGPLRRLSQNASRDARNRFDRRRMVDDYLQWYGEIMKSHKRQPNPRKPIAERLPRLRKGSDPLTA